MSVQALCKEERLLYGRFYYRFPAGESVADVYDRSVGASMAAARTRCSTQAVAHTGCSAHRL